MGSEDGSSIQGGAVGEVASGPTYVNGDVPRRIGWAAAMEAMFNQISSSDPDAHWQRERPGSVPENYRRHQDSQKNTPANLS